MDEFYVDLHCHSTMRTVHTTPNGSKKNIWEKTQNDVIDTFLGRYTWKASARVSKLSQANFYNCIEGKTRVVFDSLYPLERGFISFKKTPKLLAGAKGLESIVITASGVSTEQIKKYKLEVDYFKELNEQYDFLVSNQGPSPCGKYSYKIPSNYTELEQTLKTDPNAINVVITIEGAHVFGTGTIESQKLPLEEHKQQLKKNIQAVKNWKYPPFFMTFAHHFWNQLCGHAKTFDLIQSVTITQSQGLNSGFTELGEFVLEEMLSTKNGKRILIDTRHMSGQARMYYLNYVKKHNELYPDDIIPLITSHSAANGFEKIQHSVANKDTKIKKKATTYYGWSLNTSAEEAIAAHDSKGIIGIILDKTRHSGIKISESINKIKNLDDKKAEFNKIFFDNIFFFIEAVNKKTAWDILSIGSDFDGVIAHFDLYPEMSKLPELKKDLIHFLKKNNYRSELWFGYTPEELIHKIFTQNAMDFLKRNFK